MEDEKKFVENSIRSMYNLTLFEVREVLLEMNKIIQSFSVDIKNLSNDFELLSERVSNIETCLSTNQKKLDINDLRL